MKKNNSGYLVELVLLCGIAFISNGAVIAAVSGHQLYVEKGCLACHGINGKDPVNAIVPRISGLGLPYLKTQIADIQSGKRSNSFSHLMQQQMPSITDDEINAIALFLDEQKK